MYEDLLGAPYREGGRDKDGLDCWGLVLEVFRRLGHALPDPGVTTADIEGGRADPFAAYSASDDWERAMPPFQVFDVILFKPEGGGHVASHAGVYVGERKILHATDTAGVCTQPLKFLQHRIFGAYRLKCLV